MPRILAQLLAFGAAAILCREALAQSYTVTAMPESSGTFASGAYFRDGCVSESSDPLAPFTDHSVSFFGWMRGGSSEVLGNAHLIYRYRLDFSQPVRIDHVTVSGSGDYNSGGGSAVLRLLDENRVPLRVLSTAAQPWNVCPISYTLMAGVTGTVFYIDEFDYSTDARYRSAITVATTSLSQCDIPLEELHDLASDVSLSSGLADPRIQQILDQEIRSPRTTVTFDDLTPMLITPGAYDYRLVNSGIVLEGIAGTTQVGGTSNSGPISGGAMDCGVYGETSRLRVHFVIPGTTTPTTVARAGGFTTSEDAGRNCMEFFDAAGESLGSDCMKNPSYLPLTTVEFLGGASWRRIAYVDIYSLAVPFELDLLTFGGHTDIACNRAPIANAGADQTIQMTSCAGASVTLDASGSSDPDGDALFYTWVWSHGTASGAMPTITLPPGKTTLTLSVDDGHGHAATDLVVVDVVDVTPPVLTATVQPTVLWPANHKYVTVTPTISVSDECAATTAVRLLSVSSNEPDNGLGDGDEPNDVVVNAYGTISLRAERSGRGNGRVYTLKYIARDASGNEATTSATVAVPRNQ